MRKTYSGTKGTIELTTIQQSEYEILSLYAVRKVNTDGLNIDIGAKRSLPINLMFAGYIVTSFGCDANGYFQIEYGDCIGTGADCEYTFASWDLEINFIKVKW